MGDVCTVLCFRSAELSEVNICSDASRLQDC